MNEEFKRILNIVEEIEVPDDLVQGILNRVDGKIRQQSRVKALSFSLISTTSLIISIPIIKAVITSFTQSGIYNYLSLIFSDSDIVITYWKEILMTIAESIPAISVIALLSIATIFIWSTVSATREVKLITA